MKGSLLLLVLCVFVIVQLANAAIVREPTEEEKLLVQEQEKDDENQSWIIRVREGVDVDKLAKKYGFYNFGSVRNTDAYLFRLFKHHNDGKSHLLIFDDPDVLSAERGIHRERFKKDGRRVYDEL